MKVIKHTVGYGLDVGFVVNKDSLTDMVYLNLNDPGGQIVVVSEGLPPNIVSQFKEAVEGFEKLYNELVSLHSKFNLPLVSMPVRLESLQTYFLRLGYIVNELTNPYYFLANVELI
jgi:hypothetical protein